MGLKGFHSKKPFAAVLDTPKTKLPSPGWHNVKNESGITVKLCKYLHTLAAMRNGEMQHPEVFFLCDLSQNF